jgi:hypothetical protein
MDNFKMDLEEYRETPHYYGDIVRVLFLTAGLVMLVSLPFYHNLTQLPLIISIMIILGMGLLAGLTNPKVIYVIVFDVAISLCALFITEYFAVVYFHEQILYSLINQGLAILFFISLYYSSKTLRGFFIRKYF